VPVSTLETLLLWPAALHHARAALALDAGSDLGGALISAGDALALARRATVTSGGARDGAAAPSGSAETSASAAAGGDDDAVSRLVTLDLHRWFALPLFGSGGIAPEARSFAASLLAGIPTDPTAASFDGVGLGGVTPSPRGLLLRAWLQTKTPLKGALANRRQLPAVATAALAAFLVVTAPTSGSDVAGAAASSPPPLRRQAAAVVGVLQAVGCGAGADKLTATGTHAALPEPLAAAMTAQAASPAMMVAWSRVVEVRRWLTSRLDDYREAATNVATTAAASGSGAATPAGAGAGAGATRPSPAPRGLSPAFGAAASAPASAAAVAGPNVPAFPPTADAFAAGYVGRLVWCVVNGGGLPAAALAPAAPSPVFDPRDALAGISNLLEGMYGALPPALQGHTVVGGGFAAPRFMTDTLARYTVPTVERAAAVDASAATATVAFACLQPLFFARDGWMLPLATLDALRTLRSRRAALRALGRAIATSLLASGTDGSVDGTAAAHSTAATSPTAPASSPPAPAPAAWLARGVLREPPSLLGEGGGAAALSLPAIGCLANATARAAMGDAMAAVLCMWPPSVSLGVRYDSMRSVGGALPRLAPLAAAREHAVALAAHAPSHLQMALTCRTPLAASHSVAAAISLALGASRWSALPASASLRHGGIAAFAAGGATWSQGLLLRMQAYLEAVALPAAASSAATLSIAARTASLSLPLSSCRAVLAAMPAHLAARYHHAGAVGGDRG